MRAVEKTPRRWGRRSVTITGLALAGIVCSALPALAHASFPASAGFGFAPNTMGGTGVDGATPPYPANSTQTVFARVAFEKADEPLENDDDDTTNDVKVVVPAGWTNPVCGPAKKNFRDVVATNDTNQPGADVPGWTCEITTDAAGHQVIHWSTATPATVGADSAQFFVFNITTPSPFVQTTYNSTAGNEGFVIDQAYVGGDIVHWVPSTDMPSVPPPDSITEIAANLARTVAAGPPEETTTTTTTTPTAPPAAVAAAVAARPTFTG